MQLEPFWYPLIPGLLFGLLGWAFSQGGQRRTPWAAALAWGFGFLASYYAIKGEGAAWPPREALHWLFWAMALSIPIGALHGWRWSVPHYFLGTALWGTFLWFSSESLREYQWNDRDALQIPLLIVGVGAFALWLYSALLRARPTGIQVPGAFALTLGGAAFTVGQSMGGSAHIIGGMACVALLWALLGAARPSLSFHHGAVLPFFLGLAGMLYLGVFFAETPQLSAALLLLAPVGLRFGWWIDQPKASFLVSLLATAALVAAAGYLAYSPADASDPYGDPYAG